MRIAVNTLSLNRAKAGMGNYIHNLVNQLAIIDKANRYFIFVSQRNKVFFRIRQKNFTIVNLGSLVTNPLFRFLWEQCILPFSLLKHKIDLFHSPGFVLPFFVPAKKVLTVADMTFITHPQVHTCLKRNYFGLLMPYSIRKADAVLTISDSTRKDLLRLVKTNPKKISTTPLAADPLFKPMDKTDCKKYLAREYGIGCSFLLFVSMIEPRKNIPSILRAFAELRKTVKTHKLVIVGRKGWMYADIFRMVKKLNLQDDVVFTGFVPDKDLARFYNAADIFLYPTLYEGFGIPILEAMACGCPVITSNVSSMPEVAGDAAFLVNPKKSDEIFMAIKRILADATLRKRMEQKGYQRAFKFSWRKTAEQTLSVYTSVGHAAEDVS